MNVLLMAAIAVAGLGFQDEAKPTDATMGAKPPSGAEAVILFGGENLDAWTHRDGTPAKWTTTHGYFTVKPGSGDIQTRDKFGSYTMHVEFNTPYMPEAKGQGRGNSGVYMDGIYEVQVLDSYGLELQDNDCGGIYKQVVPRVNVCKPPLQWQTYDIDFTKAEMDGDKVVKKARITVKHNGVMTIDNAEISPTPGGTGNQEGEPGPILLQDHGNEVQYRNIWLVPRN